MFAAEQSALSQILVVGGAGAVGALITAGVISVFRFGGRTATSLQVTEKTFPSVAKTVAAIEKTIPTQAAAIDKLADAMNVHGAQIADMHNCLDDVQTDVREVQTDVRGLKEDTKRLLAEVMTNTAITSATRRIERP